MEQQNYDNHDYSTENLEEAEFAQLHSIHLNMNAVSAVRAEIEGMAQNPSLTHCEECGDEIPIARQLAVRGVTHCIFCKERQERK